MYFSLVQSISSSKNIDFVAIYQVDERKLADAKDDGKKEKSSYLDPHHSLQRLVDFRVFFSLFFMPTRRIKDSLSLVEANHIT